MPWDRMEKDRCIGKPNGGAGNEGEGGVLHERLIDDDASELRDEQG